MEQKILGYPKFLMNNILIIQLYNTQYTYKMKTKETTKTISYEKGRLSFEKSL